MIDVEFDKILEETKKYYENRSELENPNNRKRKENAKKVLKRKSFLFELEKEVIK